MNVWLVSLLHEPFSFFVCSVYPVIPVLAVTVTFLFVHVSLFISCPSTVYVNVISPSAKSGTLPNVLSTNNSAVSPFSAIATIFMLYFLFCSSPVNVQFASVSVFVTSDP